jgi:hypothetical protein
MFNQQFFFNLLSKYTSLCGCLFDDIYIERLDEKEQTKELIKVPVTYSPKDKMLARVLEDPAIARPTAIVLPIISFEMGEIKYDEDRKLHTTGRNSVTVDYYDAGKLHYQYMPVPYNIIYKVYIYSKSIEDCNKIVEQVLPFFTPDWTTSVKLIPEMNVILDIPIVLNSISYNDDYDKAYPERRTIIWTLNLTLKGYFYGPIKKNPIIQFANISFYTPYAPFKEAIGNTVVEESLIVTPGLTSEHKPTSNASQSIPYNQIFIYSDYGYISSIEN